MRRIAGLTPALAALALLGSPTAGSAQEPLETVRAAGGEVLADQVVVQMRGEEAERVVELPAGTDLGEGLRELRRDPEVAWATPDPIARATRIPVDRGRNDIRRGWVLDQWNFLTPPPRSEPCTDAAPCGINAVRAWDILRRKGQPEGRKRNGKRGPIVAVVDTGVAYRDRGRKHRRSPELSRSAFVKPRDFSGGKGSLALDHNGHGTHVASTIVERTGNRDAVTGIADGLRIMPVRVLDSFGAGPASAVAKGIRYATRNGASVINLSLEFGPAFDECTKLRTVCRAIREAERAGVLVVGAAGNAGKPEAQMPAKKAFAVASTTVRGCLSRFSSRGEGVDLSAPGGGPDAVRGGSHCDGSAAGPGIVQLTLNPDAAAGGDFTRFGYPRYEGTSMSAPHVSAAAALVLGTRVLERRLGRRPTTADLGHWLRCTARPPADPATADLYGAGILDLAAALKRKSRCPGLAD